MSPLPIKLYTKRYGLVEPGQVERLCTIFEQITRVTYLPHRAYILATIAHETQHLFLAVRGKVKGFIPIANKTLYRQLDTTAKRIEQVEEATRVAAKGMLEGVYTGRELREFLNAETEDYVSARWCVDLEATPRLAKQVSREIVFWLPIAEALG